MSQMHEIPGETIPSDKELSNYQGLLNIRFRKDGKLVVGLFITNKTYEPVLTIAEHGSTSPHRILIEPGVANSAFEEPWGYADPNGRILIEEILNKASKVA